MAHAKTSLHDALLADLPDARVPVAEFRDTRPSVQFALGGIAAIGAVGTIGCLKCTRPGQPLYFVLAGMVALVSLKGLAIVYFGFGKPVVLQQFDDGLKRKEGAEEHWLPFEQFSGFTSRWTDVLRNGIYSHTSIRFEFAGEHTDCAVMKYHATAEYGKAKYDELHTFQLHMAAIVAGRMRQTLESEGRVRWTSRLTILPDALEYAKSSAGPPTHIEISRISRWQVDKGLFKLAIDGQRKPLFAESTDQANFFPGLLLFEELAGADETVDARSEESHVLVG